MQTWLISDQHFGHGNILTFKKDDGSLIRPGFSDVNDMDGFMIDKHNAVVRPSDKVYFIGDLCFSASRFNRIMPELNGTKVLIKGNHDTLKQSAYAQYFKDVRAYHVLNKILLAHIPVHPSSLTRWKGQVHGHLHANRVMTESGDIDSRYYSVCVEHCNYTPVNFDVIDRYFTAL